MNTAGAAPGSRRSSIIQTLIGVLFSAAAIYWMIVSIEWGEVWVVMKKVHWWVVIPGTAVLALQMTIRGYRWGFLLPEGEPVPLRVRVDSLMIGNFASNILPLRAGEFIRPLLLSVQSSHRFSTTFVSVVIERFFDLSAVLLSFGLIILAVDEVPGWAANGAIGLATLAACILAFMVAGSFFPTPITALARGCLKPFPFKFQQAVLRFLTDLLRGAQVLNRPARVLMICLLTAAVWISTYAMFYIYFWFFDLEGSFLMASAVTVLVALAVAVPSAPGFVGVYQLGCIAGFHLFGLDAELAAAFSIITHIAQYVPTVLYGAYALWRTEWSLAQLLSRREAVQAG